MTAAATVGPQWGPPYTYDGFGNLIQSHVTQGSGAEWSNASNPATNQMAGMTYDANGNNVTPGAPCCGTSYDMENRLVSQYLDRNVPTWVYDPSGKRVAQTNGSNFYYWTLYFYDIFGNRIETVNGDGNYPASGTGVTTNVYFGSKLIQSNGVVVATDRQGNVRYAANGTRFSYLPYGEEQTTATPDGQIKFGTYLRDSSDQSQDYADQRYYNPWYGRFNTPDPAGLKAVNRLNPLSWNRYAYVNGDPVNFTDPSGLCVIAGQTYADGTSPCPDITSVTVSAGAGGIDPGLIGGQTTASPKPASNGYVGYCDPYVDWTCTPGIDCFVGGSWVHWTGVLTCPDDNGTPRIEPPGLSPSPQPTCAAGQQSVNGQCGAPAPQPPDDPWRMPGSVAHTGTYGAYAACFFGAVARSFTMEPEAPLLGVVGAIAFLRDKAAVPGIPNPVAAVISAAATLIYVEANMNQEATDCSQQTGYVPWVLKP